MSEYNAARLLSSSKRSTNWLQRVLLVAAGLTVAVAAFFFLMFALAAGAVLALAIGIRFWWVTRKLRAQAKNTQALEGEYTIVERTPAERLER
jgi:hypothetical protein